jgi:hypothetical protein
MVTLLEFIKEEVNDYIKNKILETIKKGKACNKAYDEFIFNRYSLEIDYTEEKVIIYDDIYSEDEPLSIPLAHLLEVLLNRSE